MNPALSRRQLIKLLGTTGAGFSIFGNTMAKHLSLTQSAAMLTRAIPSTGELLPIVGLGSWIQFDVDDNSSERKTLEEVLKTMQEKGGKLIDSSPMYGKSEKVIGDLAKETGLSDKLFYATKVWTRGEQEGISQMKESMQKMRRTKMDLMQIHNLVDWKTHIRTLQKWKAQGLIRYIGITHYTTTAHQQLEDIIKTKVVDFAQFNYSIGIRNAEDSLLKTAKDNGVAVIINEPFESGALFSKVKGKALPPWAADYDINSWGQFFLKYILSHPAVNCVIPGTSNPKHAADNMGAGYGKLPDAKGREKMAIYFDNLT